MRLSARVSFGVGYARQLTSRFFPDVHRLVWQYSFSDLLCKPFSTIRGITFFQVSFFHHVHFVYPSVQLFRGYLAGSAERFSLFLRCVGSWASCISVFCSFVKFIVSTVIADLMLFQFTYFGKKDSAVYGHGLLPTAWNAIFPPSHTDVVC